KGKVSEAAPANVEEDEGGASSLRASTSSGKAPSNAMEQTKMQLNEREEHYNNTDPTNTPTTAANTVTIQPFVAATDFIAEDPALALLDSTSPLVTTTTSFVAAELTHILPSRSKANPAGRKPPPGGAGGIGGVGGGKAAPDYDETEENLRAAIEAYSEFLKNLGVPEKSEVFTNAMDLVNPESMETQPQPEPRPQEPLSPVEEPPQSVEPQPAA
ncbi:hypothetical protein HK102_009374, partial [Quaeritorhiza haematococci]